MLVDQDEPMTYQDAMKSPDYKRWREAMKSEMDSKYDNQLRTLVDPPEGVKLIGCKWVFKKKTNMDGNVQVGFQTCISSGKMQKKQKIMKPAATSMRKFDI